MVGELRGGAGQQRYLGAGAVNPQPPDPVRGHVPGLHRGMDTWTRDTCHELTLSRVQVHSTSKKLLYQLDHLVQLTNAAPNESPQKKHVSILLANF